MVLIAPNLPKEGQSWHGLMASFFESIGMDFPPLVEQRVSDPVGSPLSLFKAGCIDIRIRCRMG